MAAPEDEKRAREDDIPLPSAKRLRETASEDLPGLWSDEYELELPATFLEQLARYLDECDLAYLGSASPELLKVALFEHARRFKTAKRRGQKPFADEPVTIDWRFATTTRDRFDEALEKKRLDAKRMGDGAAAAGNVAMLEHIRDTYGYAIGTSTAWAAAAYNKTDPILHMKMSTTFRIFIDASVATVAAANGSIDVLCLIDSPIVHPDHGEMSARAFTDREWMDAVVEGAIIGNRLEPLLWLESRTDSFHDTYYQGDNVVKDAVIRELIHGKHATADHEPSREILEFAILPTNEWTFRRPHLSEHRNLLQAALESNKPFVAEFMFAERGYSIPRDAFVLAALAHNYEWAASLAARTSFTDPDNTTIWRDSPVASEMCLGSRVLLGVAADRANFGAWEWGCGRGYEADASHLKSAAESNSLEIVQWFHTNRRAIFFTKLWATWAAACERGSLRVIEWMHSHEEWRPIVNLDSMNDALVGASSSVKMLIAGWRRERWARISLAHLADVKPE